MVARGLPNLSAISGGRTVNGLVEPDLPLPGRPRATFRWNPVSTAASRTGFPKRFSVPMTRTGDGARRVHGRVVPLHVGKAPRPIFFASSKTTSLQNWETRAHWPCPRAQFPGALSCRLEAHPGDASNLGLGIDHGVQRHAFAAARLLAPGLAEIGPAREFPDHHDVEPLPHDIRAQAARVLQNVEKPGRAQVGEQAQFLAYSQKPLLRSHGLCPWRPISDRPPRPKAPRPRPGRGQGPLRSGPPVASMAAPPIRCVAQANSCPNTSPPSEAPSVPGATISGPMPSPGNTHISNFMKNLLRAA